MVGEWLETVTMRGLPGVTSCIGLPTTVFLALGSNGCAFMRSFEIENANEPLDDVWLLMVTLVVVDGEFVMTGVELGVFMDGMVAGPMGIGVDMAGAGFDIIPMPALIEVMDSKCRPSSTSTESALFRPALRALGLR
jgi:hypothetical protein